MNEKDILKRLKEIQKYQVGSTLVVEASDVNNLIKDLEQPEFELCKDGWAVFSSEWIEKTSTTAIPNYNKMPTKELAELHGKLHEIFGRLLQAVNHLEGGVSIDSVAMLNIIDAFVLHATTDPRNQEKAIEISGVMEILK